MKITEINADNYVYNKDNELCKVCIVNMITNSVIVDNYAHDDGTFYEYDFYEIKPIPLTGDMLAENGFVWDGTGYQWRLYIKDEPRIVQLGLISDGEVDPCIFAWMAGLCKKLRYLHELQNLFTALGIEKEIKL
ncbi:MAG: hypothetical protein K6G73_12530 [Marinilabiliaceae bacterium]|nr:hypothetical protein [Marinilabiliaceae bacterium]